MDHLLTVTSYRWEVSDSFPAEKDDGHSCGEHYATNNGRPLNAALHVTLDFEIADIYHFFTSDNIETGDHHHQDANGNQYYSYVFHIRLFNCLVI